MRTPRPEEQRRKLTFAFRKEEWMTFSGGAELVAIWRTSPGSAAAADMERARTGHGRYITASHDTTNWKHACADVVTRANREPPAGRSVTVLITTGEYSMERPVRPDQFTV